MAKNQNRDSERDKVVEEVFLERSPVEEVLIDNDVGFRLEVFWELSGKWGVRWYFRFVYCPSGSGIIERHHWIIKVVVEKSQISPQEAVFWHNIAPKTGQDEASVPHQSVFTYEWQNSQTIMEKVEQGQAKFTVGEEVWVKLPDIHYITCWGRGTITKMLSKNKVAVDKVPHHVLDIQRVSLPSDEVLQEHIQRSQHEQRHPAWMEDYENNYWFWQLRGRVIKCFVRPQEEINRAAFLWAEDYVLHVLLMTTFFS